MSFKKEDRIEQIKTFAQGIIDNAEKIYGNFEYPQSLRIIIEINPKEFPTLTAERSFVPESVFKTERF